MNIIINNNAITLIDVGNRFKIFTMNVQAVIDNILPTELRELTIFVNGFYSLAQEKFIFTVMLQLLGILLRNICVRLLRNFIFVIVHIICNHIKM